MTTKFFNSSLLIEYKLLGFLCVLFEGIDCLRIRLQVSKTRTSTGKYLAIALNFVDIFQVEGKIILSRLLSSFAITLQEGYQLKLEQIATLVPADYVPCTLTCLK